nr:MAG TPA: hypothetical protein [Caudoviricetes sp.]
MDTCSSILTRITLVARVGDQGGYLLCFILFLLAAS